MTITDSEAIERAVQLGFLAGADRHHAVAQLAAERIRERVRAHITELLAAFDDHDPGILRAKDVGAAEDMYQCPRNCGFVGAESDWKLHLVDTIADALAGA